MNRVELVMTVLSQATGEVADVQQGEPDPGVGRRRHQGLAHRVRIGVRTSAMIMVQVVELADDGHPGQHHLRVDGSGEREVVSPGPAGRRGVHLSPPGPERAAAGMRTPAQGSVEGVAVGVREAGQGDAVEHRVDRSGCGVRGDRGDHPGLLGDPDPVGDAVRQVGDGNPVGGAHGRSPAVSGPTSSVSAAVSASTPARQSTRSACSAGECEIPVGLRTKIIPVGIPVPARIPAS